MMNNFNEKRSGLEKFLQEQLIGPGAYNKRYFFLEKWDKSEFSGVDLNHANAIENLTEVIPEVPAYQYSSAILFPQTRELLGNISDTEDDAQQPDSTEDNNHPKGADDNDIKDDHSESITSKQQNYPNTLGLTFVVDKAIDLQRDLTISLAFRKYFNINKTNSFRQKLAVWVPEYIDEIESAINKYFSSIFNAERRDQNLFVCSVTEIKGDLIYQIDYDFLNKFLNENLIKAIQNCFGENLIQLKETEKKSVKTIYYGIKEEYKLQFYSFSSINPYGFKGVVTLFEDAIIDYVKKELENDIANYSKYKELVKELEVYKQLKNIVTDLKSVYKEKQAVPVWEAKYYNKQLVLPISEDKTKVFRSKRLSVDNEDKELGNLHYRVQYVFKGDKTYIKLLIENNNIIDLDADEPPQLNKKNQANKNAFFGLELKVHENKAGCLKQYNPPQLLDIDQEDNFNKLLYRNFVDFGEGYNTSVNWGVNEQGLHFVSSDFLPTQETPNVDFVPSRIHKIKNAIESLIPDEQVLSMRYLSSLTSKSVSDEEVLGKLSGFIDAYGGSEGWIQERRKTIADDKALDDSSIDLLNRQLNACEKDYKRLKRNIDLLRNDSEAMAAFRVMNTAMFMQLHHSISKDQITPFVPDTNSHDYYATITLEKEYKWRSFQLTFILLNIDAFVRPPQGDNTVEDVFGSGWPERNEIADLVWFPTGGGKTEAYLGIIAFTIAYRRFTKGDLAYGTTVLMRYTLRLLTLQQFQRATLLICALEAIRKDHFQIPNNLSLGAERITIGLFVGGDSLPNYWNQGDKSMVSELKKISKSVGNRNKTSTKLPFTECPWCGGNLFISEDLVNIYPNHKSENDYKIDNELSICCNSPGCTFKGDGIYPTPDNCIPFRLFDDDVYKFPPTLLFGTVDKFAALSNYVATESGKRNKDSRRLLGKGYKHNYLPPELIIQDELHLLLGPLGSAVGLYEKAIDTFCTYIDSDDNIRVKPKIVTSTATTRNTDKQIFALFNRRAEIFPKQGILCDDSFFAFYKRDENDVKRYNSNRKYVGVLPIGKTQVWMHLRVAAITLTHRLIYLKERYSIDQIFENPESLFESEELLNFYHTTLAYFNSLKEVGKTQSQLSHYLPGDVNYVTKNTTPWSFIDKLIRKNEEIKYSELTGRLSGEEVKTNLFDIQKQWRLFNEDGGVTKINKDTPPEYVVATNMISVGIDVSRFNTMIISSMPRNIAEYIQASSRVARSKEGIVFTIHHPFRSRDISHYQKFKEFHEKFYSYVEPISVTPFASKALDRYLAMYAAVIIRHTESLGLLNNDDAGQINQSRIDEIKTIISSEIKEVLKNSQKLETYLNKKPVGVTSSIDGIISEEEVEDVLDKLDDLLANWLERREGSEPPPELKFRNGPSESVNISLYISASDDNHPKHWKVSHSLREIGPTTVIKTVQQ